MRPDQGNPPAPWLLPVSVAVAAPEDARTVLATVGVTLSESECLQLARQLMAALMELHRRREEGAR